MSQANERISAEELDRELRGAQQGYRHLRAAVGEVIQAIEDLRHEVRRLRADAEPMTREQVDALKQLLASGLDATTGGER